MEKNVLYKPDFEDRYARVKYFTGFSIENTKADKTTCLTCGTNVKNTTEAIE